MVVVKEDEETDNSQFQERTSELLGDCKDESTCKEVETVEDSTKDNNSNQFPNLGPSSREASEYQAEGILNEDSQNDKTKPEQGSDESSTVVSTSVIPVKNYDMEEDQQPQKIKLDQGIKPSGTLTKSPLDSKNNKNESNLKGNGAESIYMPSLAQNFVSQSRPSIHNNIEENESKVKSCEEELDETGCEPIIKTTESTVGLPTREKVEAVDPKQMTSKFFQTSEIVVTNEITTSETDQISQNERADDQNTESLRQSSHSVIPNDENIEIQDMQKMGPKKVEDDCFSTPMEPQSQILQHDFIHKQKTIEGPENLEISHNIPTLAERNLNDENKEPIRLNPVDTELLSKTIQPTTPPKYQEHDKMEPDLSESLRIPTNEARQYPDTQYAPKVDPKDLGQDAYVNPVNAEDSMKIQPGSLQEEQNHQQQQHPLQDLFHIPIYSDNSKGISKTSKLHNAHMMDPKDIKKDSNDEITEAIRLNVEGSELLSKGRNDEAKYVYGVALRIAKRDLMEVNKAVRAAEHRTSSKKKSPTSNTSKIDFYNRLQKDRSIIEEEPMPPENYLNSPIPSASFGSSDEHLDATALRAKRITIASTIADTLNNLGVVHEINNNYDEALQSCKEALRVYREMCGRNVSNMSSNVDEPGDLLSPFDEEEAKEKDADPDIERTILNIALMERGKASYGDRMALHSQAEERLRLVDDPFGNIHHNVAGGQSGTSRKKILLLEALNIYADAFKLEKEWLGGSHPTTARTLQLIGNIRWTLIHEYGVSDIKKDDATRDLTQAAKCLEMALGPVHPHVATSFLDLAALRDLMGQTDEALALYYRALFAQKACLGNAHPDIATTLNNIGVVQYSKGDYDSAIKAYNEASEVYVSLQKDGEPPNPDASLVWNNVGELHKQARNWDLASRAFEESLKILKHSRMSDEAVVASTMISAGEVYVNNHQYDKALITYQQAYSIQCNLLGESKLDLITTLENIGDVKEIKGQFQSALDCFFVSLKIRRNELGDDHVNNAITLLKIGTLHGKMHRPQEAFIFLSESLRIFNINGVSRDHPRVKEARRKRKGAKISIPGYSKATTSSRTYSNGPESKDNNPERGEVYALDSIATSMMNRGQWDGALETYQNALKLRRETLGANHVDIGITLSNIASIHKRKDEFAEAAILYKEALRIYEINGIERAHPHVKKILVELETFI